MKVLADKLDALQAAENEGRGVRCVRTVCDYLRRGNLEDAKQVAITDWDKIRNYPMVAAFLNETIFLDNPQR
jgi:hypothetical protein